MHTEPRVHKASSPRTVGTHPPSIPIHVTFARGDPASPTAGHPANPSTFTDRHRNVSCHHLVSWLSRVLWMSEHIRWHDSAPAPGQAKLSSTTGGVLRLPRVCGRANDFTRRSPPPEAGRGGREGVCPTARLGPRGAWPASASTASPSGVFPSWASVHCFGAE